MVYLAQYHIYLFERILLCCKDINPNKQKSKLMGKDKPNANNQKSKGRMQLKGRIYMANVTEIVSLVRTGTPVAKIQYNTPAESTNWINY